MRNRIGLASAALSLVLLSAGASALRAQDSTTEADLPTVAVMDFNGFMLGHAGNSVPIGKAVTSMLVTELSDRKGMRIIERSQLHDLLQEQRLALSGRVDEGTAIQVGKMLGVQYMIFGNVAAIAKTVRLDMRAVNVETGEVLEVQKLSDKMDALLGLVEKMADLFSAKLKLEPPSARAEVPTIPVEATIDFSRAVDYEDKGDLDKAKEFYQKTLDVYPDHRGAKKALARLDASKAPAGAPKGGK